MVEPSRALRVGELATALGISPSWVRRLTEAGILHATVTAGGHRRYDRDAAVAAYARYRHPPGPAAIPSRTPFTDAEPQFRADLALPSLAEDAVWRAASDRLGLPADRPATRIARYAFTEMLNNAIDHSGGQRVTVSVWALETCLAMEIADDGVGVFEHLARGLDLDDPYAALAELTKGKRTTAPHAHSGEGIFFTSKAVDKFDLEGNGIGWWVDNIRSDFAAAESEVARGTRVRMRIDPATTRDLVDVFRRYSVDHEFVRSSPVIRLFEIGVEFVSRSEAKRLMAGMESFEEIVLDFTGVQGVGQGFVDEVFRVWALAHPATALTPVNMAPAVRFMVDRGLADRPEGGRV